MLDHSFAVMAYKDSPYLEQCLESLIKQKEKSWVYITTSTPSPYIYNLADKFKLPVYVTEAGQGIAHDWNFSLHQAKTKYVTLAHQDDIYLPEYSGECITAAERFKDTLICFTNYGEMINNKMREKKYMLYIKEWMLLFFMPVRKQIRSRFWKKASVAFGSPIACPSVMYNLEVLRKFNFSQDFSVSIDWDAWYRMAEMQGRFVYVPKQLMYHRIHEASATTQAISDLNRQKEDLLIISRIWPGPISELIARLYSISYKSNDGK